MVDLTGQNVPKLFGVLVDVYKTDMTDEVPQIQLFPLRDVQNLSESGGIWTQETSKGIGLFALRRGMAR